MEATDSKEKEALKKTYGKIVLTLENAIINSEKLDSDLSVSQRDGLDKQTELNLRFLGCELVQTAGILLKLPQVRSQNMKFLARAMFAFSNVSRNFIAD